MGRRPTLHGFSRFVAALFSFRRKTLSKALSMMEVEIDPAVLSGKEKLRAEDFTPVMIQELFNAMVNRE